MVSEQAAAPGRGDTDGQHTQELDLDMQWELALEHRRRLRRRQRERELGRHTQPDVEGASTGAGGTD